MTALLGVGIAPACSQALPGGGGQPLEGAKVAPHLLLRRGIQRLEPFPAITNPLALRWLQLLKLPETCLCRPALIRRHRQPALGAARQSLLACRRQAIPVA